VYSEDAGAIERHDQAGVDVHATLVFGADSYGVVDVLGAARCRPSSSAPAAQARGRPARQRGTVGAKVAAYAATILKSALDRAYRALCQRVIRWRLCLQASA
jgi:hypothetical protein